MDFLPLIGNLFSLIAFGLVVTGILKTFQMASDLSEMKELLRDIKRNGEVQSPAPYQLSVDRLQAAPLRDMDEQDYAAAIHASVRAEEDRA